MKIINYILFATVVLFSLVSCESDIDKIEVDSPTNAKASVLTSEGETAIVPTDKNLTQFATIFNWTRTLLGSPEIPVTYTLLVDTIDTFESAVSVSVGTNLLSKSFTYSDVNDWGIKFLEDPTNPKELDLFVKIAGSVLSQNSTPVVAPDSVYSNYLAISVTPFLSAPAVIYIAGDYMLNDKDKAPNNWTPDKSPKLYSATRNDIYVGYVYLNTEFKVCPKPAWDGDMGGSDGKLSGGDNIRTTPGFYWMEVDLNKKTYKTTPVSIGIIGSAVYGNWDKDLALTYDTKNNVLSVTDTFTKGEFKFRQDGAWGTQFGLDVEGNLIGKMSEADSDPSNIPLDVSGEYTITLNLWNYLEPSYSIKAK